MILQELYKFAQREGLPDPDYEAKPVAWVIELAEGGRFAGLVRTIGQQSADDGKKKKPKDKGKVMLIPRMPTGRTSGVKAAFLVDNASYVLGVDEKRGEEKLAAFIEYVQAAYDQNGGEALKAVLGFLADEHARAKCFEEAEKHEQFSASDLFTFRYKDQLVFKTDEARQYWASINAEKDEEADDEFTCLITGERCVPADLHPAIKSVPGGTPSGVQLVSFNSSVFESYGLAGSQNAPISRCASAGFSDALNRLLNRQYVDPETGEARPTLNTRLTDDTAALYWSEGENDFTGMLGGIVQAEPAAMEKLFKAPWSGKTPPKDDLSPFYVVILSGGQGRATLRRWHVGTIAETYYNIKQYYDDLEIVDQYHYPSVFALLGGLSVTGKNKDVPPHFAERIFLAAIDGKPFPRAILDTAVRRVRVAEKTTRPQIALIKACLCRELRRHGSDLKRKNPELQEITKAMDPNNKNTGYRLGRLFATLEGLQGTAQGSLNSTITRRFYSAASTRPAMVFGNLLSLARHHMEKTDYSPRYEKLIEDILDPLPPDRAFPAVLNIQDQALFALGYYHQKQELFKKKTPDSEAKVK